jgi:UDP-glucose 4-epimerase
VVPDSLIDPLYYYEENVVKSIQFFRHLLRNGCRHLVFSSSASVYGASSDGALHEHTPIDPRTPYAQCKAMIERVLVDAAAATALNVVILRYFNPIGADPELRSGVPSGRVGGVLNSLIDAHRSNRPFLLSGTDYATRDGSALRDYLHVWDLAMAHVAVLRQLPQLAQRPGRVTTINLGSGSGTTVRELVSAFNEVTGSQVTVLDAPRRPGDIAGAFTSVDLAERLLGWRPAYSVRDAIGHALQWSEVGQPIKIAAS